MAFLNKEDILQAEDLHAEKILVPEWPKDGQPGELYLRTLSGLEKEEWQKETTVTKQYHDRTGELHVETTIIRELFRAKLLSRVMVNQDGERLFVNHDDLIGLSGKSAAVIERLFDKALEMNGMTKKEVDEIEKNSEATNEDGSPSGSLSH